jgi:hypothetical protein
MTDYTLKMEAHVTFERALISELTKLAMAASNAADYWANKDAAGLSNKQLQPAHRNLDYLGKRPKPRQLDLPFPKKRPIPPAGPAKQEFDYIKRRQGR